MPSESTSLLPFASVLRLSYVDNLRTALVILWILNDAAIPYGGHGTWTYVGRSVPESSLILTTFNVINEAFVPFLFFLVSGRSSQMALEVKSPREFIRGKLYRLGIAFVLHSVCLQTLFGLLLFAFPRAGLRNIKDFEYWQGLVGPTPYIVMLILLDLAFLGLRYIGVPRRLTITSLASFRVAVGMSMLIIASTTFLGRNGWPAYDFLYSLRTSYMMHIIAYATGVSFPSVQDYISHSQPLLRFMASYILAAASFICAALVSGSARQVIGGSRPSTAIFYAIWKTLCIYFCSISLYNTFHTFSFTRKKWAGFPKYSFGAILVHTVPVIMMQLSLHRWSAPGPLKAAFVGLISVPISWAISWTLLQWRATC